MVRPLSRLLLFGAATCICVLARAGANPTAPKNAHPVDIQIYSPDTKHGMPDVFSRLVSQSSDGLGLSEFDDEYFARAALHVSIPLHAHDDATALMDAAKLMVDTAMPETAKGHAEARVALAQERVFVTLDSGLHSADHAEVQRHVLTAVHAFVQDCPDASSLRSGSLADKYMQRVARAADSSGFKAAWCTQRRRAAAADASAPKPLLNFAYPTATHSFDHTGARALLEAQHPSASVHRRALSPPVLKSPLHLITLRTKPLYTLPDGSRRHRMLASASSETMGNISIGYDVLVRPEVLSLDDRAEVLEVDCTAAPVITITSAHPLPIEANVTALEGDTQWGCNLDDSHVDNGFLVRVLDVADRLLESGLLQYTLHVKKLSPLAGAAVIESVIDVSPGKPQNDTARLPGPASNETAADAKRRASISCVNSDFTTVTTNGYALFDCSATVYTWRWNVDSSGNVIREKLYPFSTIRNIWFENTYFSFDARVIVELSAFAGSAGFGVPHLVAKVTFSGSARALIVATESTATSSIWGRMTQLKKIQELTVYIGSLPVHIDVDVSLASRKPFSTLSGLRAEVGARYTLTDASLGVKYSNKLKPSASSSCYCVSGCTYGGFWYLWCYVNEGCTSSVVESSRSSGFKWAKCGSFVRQNSGWDTIASLRQSLTKIGPSVTSNGVTVRSGLAKYQLGTQILLTLYDTVPLSIIPYLETELDFDPARRQLQNLEQSPGTALQRQVSGACADSYSTGTAGLRVGRAGMDIGIADVIVDFPYFGDTTLLGAFSVLDIGLNLPVPTRYSTHLCALHPTPSPTTSSAPAPSSSAAATPPPLCPPNAQLIAGNVDEFNVLDSGSVACNGWASDDFGCSDGSVLVKRENGLCNFYCPSGWFQCEPISEELQGPWYYNAHASPFPSRSPSAAPTPSQTPPPPSPSSTGARTPQPTPSDQAIVEGIEGPSSSPSALPRTGGVGSQGGGEGAAGGGGSAGNDGATSGGGGGAGTSAAAASSDEVAKEDGGGAGVIAGASIAAVLVIGAALAAVWWFKVRGQNTPPSLKTTAMSGPPAGGEAKPVQASAPPSETEAPPPSQQRARALSRAERSQQAAGNSAPQRHAVAYAPQPPSASTGDGFVRNNPLMAQRQAQAGPRRV